MMKKLQISLCTLLLILLATSCASNKSLKKPASIEEMTETEYKETVIANAGGWQALTAKMSLSLDLEGKGATKVSGTLRIKKGEVIQLSVVPLLGIEVARAEISPEGVLVIDRMNKRYVKVSFAELKALAHADLDFHTLQALFLNELFLPGKGELTGRDAAAFDMQTDASGIVLDVRKGKSFSYRFLTEAPDGRLKQTTIGLIDTPYALNWKYADFRKLEQKAFPSYMDVSFEGGTKPVRAAFALSRLSTNADWEAHTEVSRRYEKVELTDLIKMILKK